MQATAQAIAKGTCLSGNALAEAEAITGIEVTAENSADCDAPQVPIIVEE
jgi:hypothetical protein